MAIFADNGMIIILYHKNILGTHARKYLNSMSIQNVYYIEKRKIVPVRNLSMIKPVWGQLFKASLA